MEILKSTQAFPLLFFPHFHSHEKVTPRAAHKATLDHLTASRALGYVSEYRQAQTKRPMTDCRRLWASQDQPRPAHIIWTPQTGEVNTYLLLRATESLWLFGRHYCYAKDSWSSIYPSKFYQPERCFLIPGILYIEGLISPPALYELQVSLYRMVPYITVKIRAVSYLFWCQQTWVIKAGRSSY